jgi:hypothetical protein
MKHALAIIGISIGIGFLLWRIDHPMLGIGAISTAAVIAAMVGLLARD